MLTQPPSACCDELVIRVDVIAVGRFFIVLRDRLTRHEHSFLYDDNIRLGSSASGDCYELILPRWLAISRGITDAV